jgi:hypothetical protein
MKQDSGDNRRGYRYDDRTSFPDDHAPDKATNVVLILCALFSVGVWVAVLWKFVW